MKTPRKYKTLGLLDLYGFESLVEDPGGFEQLVFNFAAEKVQRVTLEWTMVLEQQEYAMEGVEWTHLNFLDNGQVVTMLERGSYGVFSILEEVCMSSNNIVMSTQQPSSTAAKSMEHDFWKFLCISKTLEIKAWRDRQQKINLNFRAVGLQGARGGSIWILIWNSLWDIFRKNMCQSNIEIKLL